MSRLPGPLLLIWLLMTTMTGYATPTQGDLPSHLDSDNPVLAARALSQLDQFDRSHIPLLAQSLEQSITPRTRAYLEFKLDSLLRSILEEVDQSILEMEELRVRSAADPANAEVALERKELRKKFSALLETARSGKGFLAASIARHVEWNSLRSPLLLRSYDRILDEILQRWLTDHPQFETKELSEHELRWLSSLPSWTRSAFSDPFRVSLQAKACQQAWTNLSRFDPILEQRGRRYFLDMGPGAVEFLRLKSAASDSSLLPGDLDLIREWETRTLLRLPEKWDGHHAITLGDWKTLSGEKKLQRLSRLMGVMREDLRPTLHYVATQDADPVLRRRCAELLSLLGDSRGARILLLERRYGANRLEVASRDAMIRAAYQLRDSGDLPGARLILEDLNDRLPHDAAARHALGLVLLRQRELPEAILQFRKSLELDPSRETEHYNLACALALSGMPEEAIASLAEAINMGYDRFSHAVEDPDLKSLHDQPEFWDLIP